MFQILVIPDMHIPYHSVSGWSLLLSVVRGWQPDIIVIIGDFADMYAISLHDKDPSRAFRLEEELIEVEEKIQELDAAALPNASRRIYIEGNHEHRISRFIKKNPVLHNLRGLSFAELIRLQEKGWEFYPYGTHTTVGKLNLTHDVGYAGVNAVRQTGQVFESNVVTGHTHRMAVHYFGNVRGESHVSASFGWLGDASKIDYRHRALVSREWQLGFGIGHMKENGTIHLQAVPIIRNECVVDGKLYSLKKGSK